MPVENNWEEVSVEIVVGAVDMLLSVGELWTVGIVTCCVNLIVDEMEGVTGNLVEVVVVLGGMLDVVVGGISMLVE